MPTRQKAEKKTTTVKYGIDTHGTIRVFAKSKGIVVKGKTVSITDVWTNLSQKNEVGEYENVALKLIFKKDDETPENNTLIKFSGFMTKSGKGDYSRPAILVQEWDYVEE